MGCKKLSNPDDTFRQDVRDVARLTIGDTGLLDFVLKFLSNTLVGRFLVHRRFSAEVRNPEPSARGSKKNDPHKLTTGTGPIIRNFENKKL